MAAATSATGDIILHQPPAQVQIDQALAAAVHAMRLSLSLVLYLRAARGTVK